MAAEEAGAGAAVEQIQHVLGHGVQRYATRKLALDVSDIFFDGLIEVHVIATEQSCIHIGKHRGGMIGCAADHESIDTCKVAPCIFQTLDAAIENDRQL